MVRTGENLRQHLPWSRSLAGAWHKRPYATSPAGGVGLPTRRLSRQRAAFPVGHSLFAARSSPRSDYRPPSNGRGQLRDGCAPARTGRRMSQLQQQSTVRNRLLAALPADDFAVLAPALRLVGLDLSTTLPPSEPEVMLEVLPAVRAAQEQAGERRHDPSADGGQARRGRRSGLGRDLGPFPPRAASAAGRRRPAGTAARGDGARARTAPRSGRARARP